MSDFSTVEGKDMVDWSLDELYELYKAKGDFVTAQAAKDQKRIVGQDASEFLFLKNNFFKSLLAQNPDEEAQTLILLGRFLLFYEMRLGGRVMLDSLESQALAEMMVGLYRSKHFSPLKDLAVVLINKDHKFNAELDSQLRNLPFEQQLESLMNKHSKYLSPMFPKLVSQVY